MVLHPGVSYFAVLALVSWLIATYDNTSREHFPVVLAAEAHLSLVTPGRRPGRPRTADRLLFTPTLPGALLEEATARRVGVTVPPA